MVLQPGGGQARFKQRGDRFGGHRFMVLNPSAMRLGALLASAVSVSACAGLVPQSQWQQRPAGEVYQNPGYFPGGAAMQTPVQWQDSASPAVAGYAQMPTAAQPGMGYGGMGQGAMSGNSANMQHMSSSPVPAMTAAVQSQIHQVEQRIERIERALIRLDRRMQLVEQNALGTGMSSNNAIPGVPGHLRSLAAHAAQAGAPGLAYEQQSVAAALGGVPPSPITPYGAQGFMPVAQSMLQDVQPGAASGTSDGRISGSLQAAAPNPAISAAKAGSHVGGRLPRLADEVAPAAAGPQDLAVWTVNFKDEKIWPDRSQLPLSRDVVSRIQQNREITLFARGQTPNSRLFRERVRALSRYLSKVTGHNDVIIATQKAEHMDSNTIEILATR